MCTNWRRCNQLAAAATTTTGRTTELRNIQNLPRTQLSLQQKPFSPHKTSHNALFICCQSNNDGT
jgi:hypothetical protein